MQKTTAPALRTVVLAAVAFKPGAGTEEVWDMVNIHRPDAMTVFIDDMLNRLVTAGELRREGQDAEAGYFPPK
jgi:hypothetical protein